MALRSKNLNLLPILRVLLEERSVSRASSILGLSQPATSAALARLRDEFKDPLLVPVGRGLQPTDRAKELLPGLKILCQNIDAFMEGPDFHPSKTTRTFVVSATDYVVLLIGAELIDYLVEHAPGVTVQFIDPTPDVARRLTAGEFDVAIVADHEAIRGLPAKRGYLDRLVGVVGAYHPLADNDHPSVADINQYPRIMYAPRTDSEDSRRKRKLMGLSTPSRLLAEQFVVLPFLASRSKSIAIVPGALAQLLGNFTAIKTIHLPGHAIAIDTSIVWSPTNEADLAHRWFRSVLQALTARHLHLPHLL